ncbi:hypothetical protein NG798_16280 [Ancylothrix sp. C2]|uniref:hypothetical protein n=1 Tax=Ancylothrix sp. D3o TaxID=2953691 RepID=UPI0021BB2A85|nr:hypothetical protein [Ancylothrix sp. D3o]MCT7951359.1 hypothetical protein [Ancylothrix sp. D3o]
MIQECVSTLVQSSIQTQPVTQLETLKYRMLEAETLAELHSLITDYSDMEINEVYHRLTSSQQSRLDAIQQRDSFHKKP